MQGVAKRYAGRWLKLKGGVEHKAGVIFFTTQVDVSFVIEVGETDFPLLVHSPGAFQNVATSICAAATEVRVGQQTEYRIRFKILVDVTEFPGSRLAGFSEFNPCSPAGIQVISSLVLYHVSKEGKGSFRQRRLELNKQLYFFIVVCVSTSVECQRIDTGK